MNYVAAALRGLPVVKTTYPPWLYWISRWTNKGVRTMWRYRARVGEIVTPILQKRIDATKKFEAKEAKEYRGPRSYEDGVQWLLDAYAAHGKTLSSETEASCLNSS